MTTATRKAGACESVPDGGGVGEHPDREALLARGFECVLELVEIRWSLGDCDPEAARYIDRLIAMALASPIGRVSS